MISDPTAAEPPEGGTTLDDIERLVDELAELARSDIPAHTFYAELLGRGARAMAAIGGAVWLSPPHEPLKLECKLLSPDGGLSEGQLQQSQHLLLVRQLLSSKSAQALAPLSGSTSTSASDEAKNPTDLLLLACRIDQDGQPQGVIEIFQRADISPSAQRGYLEFLSALAELAAEFQRNRQLRDLRNRQGLWNELDQFAQRVHAHLDLDATVQTIAEEGRRLLGCDRVSVAICRGSKCRLIAISGVESFDRRANSVRHLEQLSQMCVQTDEPLWHAEDSSDLPPELETMLQRYLDESHARVLGIVPLHCWNTEGTEQESTQSKQPLGTLIVERFDGTSSVVLKSRADAIATHSGVAIRNAQTFRNLPLMPLERLLLGIGWLTHARQLPKTLLVSALLIAVVAALILVPADFEIQARGQLQPLVRQEIFASRDGVVDQLHAQHDQAVEKNEVLAMLRSSELELEFRRIEGEQQTAQKRLDAVQAARVENRLSDSREASSAQKLSAEEEEVKALLESLDKQLAILKTQQSQLSVRSPFAGQVVTWDVQQRLASRPVKRGQALMTVARLDGPWVLELDVPDKRIGHVLAAQSKDEKLPVRFLLATDPGKSYEGWVTQVGMATETSERDEATVKVIVSIDHDIISPLRPGATATANIDCGRRPIGYVWFHELFEAIQSRLLF